MNFLRTFNEIKEISSDINEHLPTLYKYGEMSNSIVELGTRWMVSTYAFLAAKPDRLWSIDIERPDSDKWENQANLNFENILKEANDQGIDYKFIQGDSRTAEIECDSFDLLFVDTIHTSEMVAAELNHWGNKVDKFIIFHDVVLFPEINIAINEFVDKNPQWVELERFSNNCGLLVLKNEEGS
jgi:hypothetical protein